MGKIRDFFKAQPKKVSKAFGGETILSYPEEGGVYNSGVPVVDYEIASKQGMLKNQVVFHIVREIANGGSSIPFICEDKEIAALLNNPSPRESYSSWMNKLITQKLLSGSSYAWALSGGSRIGSLDLLRPDRVEIETGMRDGFSDELIAFKYQKGKTVRFPVDDLGRSEVFQSKFYHPLSDWEGLSPLQAAMLALQQNNEMASMNKQSLENGGTLKGFIAMKEGVDKSGVQLTTEQMKAVQESINDKLGRKGRGVNYPVMNLPFTFEQLGMTQEEMQYIESKEVSAKDIAIAFNYPSFLLGYSDSATFNNVSEARQTLYENNIIPLVETVLNDFSRYLMLNFKKDVQISLDVESIVVLQDKLYKKRETLREDFKAGLISDVEYRIAAGLPETPEAGTRYFPQGVVPEDLVSLDFNEI